MGNSKFKSFLPCIRRIPTKTPQLQIQSSNGNGYSKSYILSESNSFLTKNQIESCKKIVNRMLKRSKIKYSMAVQYSLVKTKKSIGSRMGKGKGKVTDRVAFLKKDSVLFEFTDIPLDLLKPVVHKISYKLPISISWKSSQTDVDSYCI